MCLPFTEKGPQISGRAPPTNEVRHMHEVMEAQRPGRQGGGSFEITQGLNDLLFEDIELTPVLLVMGSFCLQNSFDCTLYAQYTL